MKVAEGAFYFETVAANGVAMRAARNERHVVARRGHPPAEITSHGTRCHDRDPHLAFSASKAFVCPKTSTLEVSGCQIGSFTSDGHTCRFTSNSDRTDASQRIDDFRPIIESPRFTCYGKRCLDRDGAVTHWRIGILCLRATRAPNR